ncbi:hypothetical protein L21_0331 [Methanoculleus chikugoensis]|jgi:hypothetical protein|uniref:Uncharacterized protein n=1 Tax=Methanoculleus chikugoensis TaxID=118126 RepID=A0A1M4MHW0_9EURY|nr:hypothetical protein [Methanoculleus chikugoensis]MDD4568218.1 hypothetical protein [Methanoculleus chikugoensis]NMA09567.1 hypothetical protein [Methanomicrobiales archaeon]SCL74456.1 hypothetical protein L21_0331 [Methanoculleus chikugoensis]
MNEPRRLTVVRGRVRCTEKESVPVDQCRLCVHSARVVVKGIELPSPARAYCSRCRDAPDIAMAKIEAVLCDDLSGEGFRSIANIIS